MLDDIQTLLRKGAFETVGAQLMRGMLNELGVTERMKELQKEAPDERAVPLDVLGIALAALRSLGMSTALEELAAIVTMQSPDDAHEPEA